MSVSETTPPATGSSGLILDSLEVKNFRAFRHLTIEKLGRVNLITGKNNVGKSSLLEALWIYARRGHPTVFRSILTNRRETKLDLNSVSVDNNLVSLPYQATLEDYGFLSLFSTRPKMLDDDLWFSIGSLNNRDDSVVVTLAENQSSFGVDAWITVSFFDSETTYILDDLSAVPARSRTRSTSLLNQKQVLSQFVMQDSLPDDSVANLWDRIALTEVEDEIIASLKIVLPSIERISFLEYKSSKYRRAAIAKISGANEPVPFRSLGDGLNRIFALSVALASVRNGILICDEIENGIHYSVLPDLWRFIFQTARRLNVQVFATTHSWDCIEAFQQAAAEDEADGALIRLQNKNGDVIATVFDEADLAEVTRNGIEVR